MPPRSDPGSSDPGSSDPGSSGSDLSVGAWNRVSPAYAVVLIAGAAVTGAVLAAGALFLWLLTAWAFGWLPLAAVVAVTGAALVVARRRARSIGYQLRADDLLFRRGIMFQRFVSVPYGRMQLIDVTRGPVGRLLGLADLRFVTAAAATGVVIPGLPESEAARVRDRLVELAESRRAGL